VFLARSLSELNGFSRDLFLLGVLFFECLLVYGFCIRNLLPKGTDPFPQILINLLKLAGLCLSVFFQLGFSQA